MTSRHARNDPTLPISHDSSYPPLPDRQLSLFGRSHTAWRSVVEAHTGSDDGGSISTVGSINSFMKSTSHQLTSPSPLTSPSAASGHS